MVHRLCRKKRATTNGVGIIVVATKSARAHSFSISVEATGIECSREMIIIFPKDIQNDPRMEAEICKQLWLEEEPRDALHAMEDPLCSPNYGDNVLPVNPESPCDNLMHYDAEYLETAVNSYEENTLDVTPKLESVDGPFDNFCNNESTQNMEPENIVCVPSLPEIHMGSVYIKEETDVGEEATRDQRMRNKNSGDRSSALPADSLSPKKSVQCDICEKQFTKNTSLRVHMKSVHFNERVQCPICEKLITQKSGLMKHMALHTGMKPFNCEVCGKAFAQKGYLTVHMRVHNTDRPHKRKKSLPFPAMENSMLAVAWEDPEKPYTCHICGKSLLKRAYLTYHMQTHTGQKRLKCDICDKTFSKKSHLTIHMRSHTGDRPYKCQICMKTFLAGGTLNKHKRTHTVGKTSRKVEGS